MKFNIGRAKVKSGLAGEIMSLREATLHQFVESVRRATARGVRVAARTTVMATGNAAYHWIVGAHDGPPITDHPRYIARDLRGTNPLIRKKHSGPMTEGDKARVAAEVQARELSRYIEKHIVGNDFPVQIYLYNAIPYPDNAQIAEAAKAGAQAIVDRFEQHFSHGEIRKRKRR